MLCALNKFKEELLLSRGHHVVDGFALHGGRLINLGECIDRLLTRLKEPAVIILTGDATRILDLELAIGVGKQGAESKSQGPEVGANGVLRCVIEA